MDTILSFSNIIWQKFSGATKDSDSDRWHQGAAPDMG